MAYSKKQKAAFNDFLNSVNTATNNWNNQYGSGKTTSGTIFNNVTTTKSNNKINTDYNTYWASVNKYTDDFTKQQKEYQNKLAQKIDENNKSYENKSKEQYYETKPKNLIEEQLKQEEEIKKQQNTIINYFTNNKEKLKEERTNNLIYNWNISNHGEYDYGELPIQDENSFLKAKDKDGNIYWIDANNSKVYDSKYNEVLNKIDFDYVYHTKEDIIKNDKGYIQKIDSAGNKYWYDEKNNKLYDAVNYDTKNYTRLHNYINTKLDNPNFINSLKTVYKNDEKGIINPKALKGSDRFGITTIDSTKYQFLVDGEKQEYDDFKNKSVFNQWQIDKGFQFEQIDSNKKSPLFINDDERIESPLFGNNNIYKQNFDKLNKAIEEGNYTTANNALQEINQKYFGKSYNDGWIEAVFGGGNADENEFFFNRFNTNVNKLNVINNSLQTTTDPELLEELRKEKNKLELENQLIQYNRIFAVQSDLKLIDKIDNITNPINETWNKVGEVWSDTFEAFDDGYDVGDIKKTFLKVIHNEVQTLGALGKTTNAGLQGMEHLLVSDMDDSEFKETWLPAIMDVATYIIPYVGQARMIINYSEPASVIEAGINGKGSVTIDTKDGSIKTPDAKNVIGAAVNIAANFMSDKIFSNIRSRFTGEQIKAWYSNSGRKIGTTILEEATGEAMEEFVQTYAEYMQNMDEDLSWGFFKEHWNEAVKAATIAFVTAGGASAVGTTVGEIKNINKPKSKKISIETSGDAVDNIRIMEKGTSEDIDIQENIDIDEDTDIQENIDINDDIEDNSGKTIYNSSDTDEFEDFNYESEYTSEVTTEEDEDAYVNIAESLQNGEVITILDEDIYKNNRTKEINLDDNLGTTTLSDAVINDNIKEVIVPSSEMETYLKNIRDDLPIYVVDPKSPDFMQNVKDLINDTKTNIETRTVNSFTPVEYTFTPDEMKDINKMVKDYLNRGNMLDAVNNPTEYKLQPITVSDITDSSFDTILNTIKNKFLEEVDKNRFSKETAQQEFKSLNKSLSEYAIKAVNNREYVKDNRGRIITFVKRGSDLYEAISSLPAPTADLNVYANVKTNGNIINGNLNTVVQFTKSQMTSVNNLIDKLKLKGKYIDKNSTYRDFTTLVKSNRDFSKELLQAVNAEGLIEGKQKARLYTAFDDLDNSNPTGAVKNTIKSLDSKKTKTEVAKKSMTEAPKSSKIKKGPSEVAATNEALDVEKYAQNLDDTTELNNVELEKAIDNLIDNMTDKRITKSKSELKQILRKALFDRRTHINEIAKQYDDVSVRAAIAELDAVSSDARVIIESAMVDSNGNIIGKPLDAIFKDNGIVGKKKTKAFTEYMLYMLNNDREIARVEKIFPELSGKQSIEKANKIAQKYPQVLTAAKELKILNNYLLDRLVEGGVITEKVATTLKNRYQYYLPVYSSDLSTFNDLTSNKYIKALTLDDTIKDVTKTSKKQLLSLKKSMENKIYNVLSAVAKNKLAQEMALSGHYEGKGNADLIYYRDGVITKTKTTPEILSDINGDDLSHWVDTIIQYPILKQIVDLNKLSYKFILDDFYQIKNVIIDFTDSQLVYSKDKKNFAKNYIRAVYAIANNSELYNEFKAIGLAEYGSGWKAPKVTYNEDGSVNVKQNKFQRIAANLEALPKLAEYISLKEKYMKQARQDYNNGLYTKDGNHLKFNKDEKYTLNHWSGTDSYAINEHFRKGTEITEDLQKISDGMDSILDKTKSESGTYNRSIELTGEDLEQFINKYKKGKIVTEDAFTSMSKDIIYDDTMNIQMEIKTNYAKDLSSELRTNESERLLKRGSKFRVDDITIDGNNVKLKLTDVSEDNTLYKDNISIKDVENQIKMKAKVEAQDVNLNFNSGGTLSKALSKGGFKFLNAGMLGFDKFVTHVGEGVKTPKGMGRLLLEFASIGATTTVANMLLNGDDEEYDRLPYYYKNNYYMIKVGDDKWIRIPKGRVQTLYDVIFEYATGIREEDDAQAYIDSLQSAFDLAVMPPALEGSSPLAGIQQIIKNEDAFGNSIYSNEYDSLEQKIQKSGYHLLGSYFGRYGRMVKDLTDGDGTTDVLNEFDYYKDTTKANRHYQTVINLVDYYKNKDNVKTLDDKAEKKYVDTQNYALRTINSEISQGKKAGQTTSDLKMKYSARDDLLTSIINNHKNYDKQVDENGNTWYYFDDLTLMYNAKTNKFVKK